MELTVDAILALAEIAGEHGLDPEMIGVLYETACHVRIVARQDAIQTLQTQSVAGNGAATACLERIARATEPTPVYRENVEEAYRLLTGEETA